MELALIIVIVAVITVVGVVALSITARDQPVARRRGQVDTPGPLEGALDVIDRSIGMYVLRRLTGRRTTRPPEVDIGVALSADQVAYRIGASAPLPSSAPRATRDEVDVPVAAAAGAASTAAAARAAAAGHAASRPESGASVVPMGVVAASATSPRAVPRTPKPPAAPRERLVRDAGMALIGLTIVGLVAFFVWPQNPAGKPTGSVFAVARASSSPPSDPASDFIGAATGSPIALAPTPVATPELDAGPVRDAEAHAQADPEAREGRRNAQAHAQADPEADAETHAQADARAGRTHQRVGGMCRPRCRDHLHGHREFGCFLHVGPG